MTHQKPDLNKVNKLIIAPIVIIAAQLTGVIHLFYTYRYKDSHIPIAFIELNILALLNFFILIIAYLSYFRTRQKLKIWWAVVALSLIIIAILVIVYTMMLIDKY